MFKNAKLTDAQLHLYALAFREGTQSRNKFSAYEKVQCQKLVEMGIFVRVGSHGDYWYGLSKESVAYENGRVQKVARKERFVSNANEILSRIAGKLPDDVPYELRGKGKVRLIARFGGEEDVWDDNSHTFKLTVCIDLRCDTSQLGFGHQHSLSSRGIAEHRLMAKNILDAMNFQEAVTEEYSEICASLY